MIHQLFTFELWIISNFLTSSLLTFSVIYTFDFYIASEELKIYQKYLIKKVPDFLLLEKFIHDNYLRNSFLQGLSNFSFLLLLFEGSKLVSQATWRNEHNPVVLTQSKIQPLTGKIRGLLDGGFFHLQVCYHPLKRHLQFLDLLCQSLPLLDQLPPWC